MVFTDKLLTLLQNSENNTRVMENGTRLLFPTSVHPPLAKHYIYSPMLQQIKQSLIQSYRRAFPDELIELYNIANGFALFWERIPIDGTELFLAHAKITVFGVPIQNDRKQLEPLNIVLEDFDRKGHYPMSWLKFGTSFVRGECDLFYDTEKNHVYMIEINGHSERGRWKSIDECLCDLFDSCNS